MLEWSQFNDNRRFRNNLVVEDYAYPRHKQERHW